jgi:hypothetical protein
METDTGIKRINRKETDHDDRVSEGQAERSTVILFWSWTSNSIVTIKLYCV